MAPPGWTAIGGVSYLCPEVVEDRVVIERRGLIIVGGSSAETPPLPSGSISVWRRSLEVAYCFRRERLVEALAQTLQFPPGFFATSPELAVSCLDQLRGAQLVSSYGGGETPFTTARPNRKTARKRARAKVVVPPAVHPKEAPGGFSSWDG